MPLWVEEYRQLESLRDPWDTLLEGSAAGLRIFSSYDFQLLWRQRLAGDATLRLLAIRDENRLVGIWPMVQANRTLSFTGGDEVCDYLDIIALRGYEQAVLGAGLRHLAGSADLDLRFVPQHSPTICHLPQLAEQYGLSLERSVDEVCPGIDLPNTWDAYLLSLSKKDRHELRRKLRRLNHAGSVEYQIVSGASAEIQPAASDFLSLHRSSNPDKAAFMTAQMEEFFRALIAHFLPLGTLRLYFLALAGQRVASALCFSQGDELWLYNSGFNRDYAYCSVGLAIKAYCVEHAIMEGKRKVDFLRGREPYKYDLGARDHPVWRLQLRENTGGNT